MRRLSIIFNVALLSLLIIMVGGGVTLTHCNHTGNLSIAQLPGTAAMPQGGAETGQKGECAMKPRCCSADSRGTQMGELPCMDYKLLKCQPSIFPHGFSFSHAPVCVRLPEYLSSAVSPRCVHVERQRLAECSGRHGPPRRYLRLITVLQI